EKNETKRKSGRAEGKRSRRNELRPIPYEPHFFRSSILPVPILSMSTDRALAPITGDAIVLVNELVRLAVAQRASDIHLEPKHDMLHVRMRVDGALVDVQPIGNAVAPNVISRVKVLAKMD